MRKLFSLIIVLALTLSFAVTGHAQTADLTLTDAEAKPGDTVYLTVKLQTQLTADAMGLSYTYDEKILEPMPVDSWSWEVKGAIKNFDIKKDRAVWGANDPTELEGDICVMAFRVLENAKLTQTKVTCELIIKNQGEEVGKYTADGIIGQHCEHEYGPWSGQSRLWHTAECKLCGKVLTQSHMWDDGVETTVDGKQLMRYTCTTCRVTNDIEPSHGIQETKPTGPADVPVEPTLPTMPDQDGNEHSHEEYTRDTKPTAPDGHDHDEQQNADIDMQTDPTNDDHINVEPTEESTHDHTHEETPVEQNDPVTGIVIAAALVVLLGTAVYFVKKK